jgi:hypothetical protein
MDIVQQESTTAACKLLEVLLDTSHNVSKCGEDGGNGGAQI